jgi:hypothetical protein
MSKKTIKIQVWTDLFYVRFIAIWRPEEDPNYISPIDDTRSDQEKNIPYLLVTSAMYKGRSEVIGINPVAPSQHPMPAEFLQQQIRHISYMFANEFGIFQPPSKADANTFISKMTVNYSLVKELIVDVSPATGSTNLKLFRDSLAAYSNDELEKINIMMVGENPNDAYAKKIDDYIYTPINDTLPQYITITKLMNVYNIDDPYINNSILPPDPGTDKPCGPGSRLPFCGPLPLCNRCLPRQGYSFERSRTWSLCQLHTLLRTRKGGKTDD